MSLTRPTFSIVLMPQSTFGYRLCISESRPTRQLLYEYTLIRAPLAVRRGSRVTKQSQRCLRLGQRASGHETFLQLLSSIRRQIGITEGTQHGRVYLRLSSRGKQDLSHETIPVNLPSQRWGRTRESSDHPAWGPAHLNRVIGLEALGLGCDCNRGVTRSHQITGLAAV